MKSTNFIGSECPDTTFCQFFESFSEPGVRLGADGLIILSGVLSLVVAGSGGA